MPTNKIFKKSLEQVAPSTNIIPRESTRVVVNPKIRIDDAHRQEYENAKNRLDYAVAEGAYHGARFIPATRGITAVGDMVGLNPAAIAQKQGVSASNISTNVAKKGLTEASKYTPNVVNPYNIATNANRGLKVVGAYNKANAIKQTYDVAKEIYDANQNFNQVLDKMPRSYTSIDTGVSIANNENINSKLIRPRRYLGGNY